MTVDTIDAATKDLRARLPGVERAYEAAQQDAEHLDGARVRLAYQLHVQGNTAVESELARVAADFDAAKRRERDTESALVQIQQQLSRLVAQREDAEREDYGTALDDLAVQLRRRGVALDRDLRGLAKRMAEYLALAGQALRLRNKLGLGMSRTPKQAAVDILKARLSSLLHPVLEGPLTTRAELLTFTRVADCYGRRPLKEDAPEPRQRPVSQSPSRTMGRNKEDAP